MSRGGQKYFATLKAKLFQQTNSIVIGAIVAIFSVGTAGSNNIVESSDKPRGRLANINVTLNIVIKNKE